MPATRASSGALAVLSSTPTWFTQLSTTSSSFSREQRLVDVVLVLADADALGIDLHQLGERILQAARDADRAAHREVEVGELFARDVARRVDARARLADRHAERPPSSPSAREHLAHERLGLAAVGAVADRDRARACTSGRARAASAARARERVVALHEVDRRVLEELAGRVDDRALAAGALPGIDAEHRLACRAARRAAARAGSRRRRRPRRDRRAA